MGTPFKDKLAATGLGWLPGMIVVLAAVAVLVAPLAILARPGMRQLPLEVSKDASSAWLVLAGTLVWVCFLYVAWRVIRRLLLYVFGCRGVFGASAGARIAALGLAALAVPNAVTALVMAPVSFLMQLALRLPRVAAQGAWVGLLPTGTETAQSIKDPVSQLSLMMQQMVVELSAAFAKAIEAIPVPEALLGLAMWAVLGNLLSAAAGGDTAQPGTSRLGRYLAVLSSTQRYGIALTTVFLFGAYLSIAAMVAIPWLHEERVSPALSHESLEKTLAGILPSTQDQLKVYLEGLPSKDEDPLALLTKFVAHLKIPATPAATILGSAINDAIRESRSVRTSALDRVNGMPAEIVQRAAQMNQAALRAFDLETASPMSTQERSYFVREIQRSVASDYEAMEGTLRNCANALNGTDRRLREITQNMRLVQALAQQVSAQSELPADTRARQQPSEQLRLSDLGDAATEISAASLRLRNACDVKIAVSRSAYTPPVPGSTWGPFGLVASWLLRTKSFALTIITGMLGFGLLGSVISTFVRSGTRNEQVSLTSEVVSVLVRGLSAAVVVFLAVKGGLAVFSSADTEPNAYVVFFTCLVGAVFSEDVWNWARGRFLDSLSSNARPEQKNQSMAGSIERPAQEPPKQQ